MSMNKMFKKVLAVVAAGAMTMGMAMPTFAAEGGKATGGYGLAKTYNTEAGKAEKFSFTAAAGQEQELVLLQRMLAVTMPEIFHLPHTADRNNTSRRGKSYIFRHFQRQVSMSTL